MKVTLTGGWEITDVLFLNPDERTWDDANNAYLVGASWGFSIDFVLVLADSFDSAVDEAVDADVGPVRSLRIEPEDMDDYLYIHVDGVEMNCTDARRRFPTHNIDAIRDAGYASGETWDSCHYTGSGTAYDTDHLYGHGPEEIKSIELEPGDFHQLPKVFESMDEARDAIREAFARSAFILEWADAVEENNRCFPGETPRYRSVELADVAPEWTPAPYLRWAESSIRTIEESIGIGIVEALHRACLVPCSNGWESRLDPDDFDSAETFGHLIGMQFQGHGVSWSDSHPGLPFRLPYGEIPHCFLTGDVELADFADEE